MSKEYTKCPTCSSNLETQGHTTKSFIPVDLENAPTAYAVKDERGQYRYIGSIYEVEARVKSLSGSKKAKVKLVEVEGEK